MMGIFDTVMRELCNRAYKRSWLQKKNAIIQHSFSWEKLTCLGTDSLELVRRLHLREAALELSQGPSPSPRRR